MNTGKKERLSKRRMRKNITSFQGMASVLTKTLRGNRKNRPSRSAAEDTVVSKDIHYEEMDVSLVQAARNGLTEVVMRYLEEGDSTRVINDVDEEGFTALHYASRFDQLDVMKILVDYGADINVSQQQDEIRPLHLSCKYNCYEAVKFLLEHQAIINIKDSKGRTPLHYATRKGHERIIKMLISVSTCKVNEQDDDLTSPLIMASLQGNENICETLISRGAQVELRDINNMTPLMWAAAEGHTKVCEVLLKSALRYGQRSQERYIRAYDKEGSTALHLAVLNGKLSVVNLLICYGANVNSTKMNRTTCLHLSATAGYVDILKVLIFHAANINCQDGDQMTPVHRAALYNKVDVLEYLISRGADINAKDKKNMSPLHCACWKGQLDAVNFLLNQGAHISERDITLKTALHWAVKCAHFPVVMALLANATGQSLVGLTDKNDQTALHYAAYIGNVEILKLLLDVGAKCDAKDQEERSPLHIAAQNDRVDCIEYLIHASSHETNDEDLDGRTPLLLACLSGHHRAVQALLSLGADVMKRDDEHCTGLMLAASQGHSNLMRILLDNHASVNDLDKMKNTALHYACANGHTDVVELLLDRKADVTLKNAQNSTPLDLAIDNQHIDVANLLFSNKSTCQDCMSVRDDKGNTPMDRLIAKMPETVIMILDHCIERTSRDDEEKNLTITFNYKYIDPGPDDPSSLKNRYLALNTMVNHGRDALLSHPLCQNLLFQKWVNFGRSTFIINLITYIGYLSCLTAFAVLKYMDQPPDYSNSENASNMPVSSSNNLISSKTGKLSSNISCFFDSYLGNINNNWAVNFKGTFFYANNDTSPKALVSNLYRSEKSILMVMLYFFVATFFIRDIIKIFSQRWRYLTNIYNIIVWMLIAATILFVQDYEEDLHIHELSWRAGWVALFLAWINFIMYLRRIDYLGIYVIMFVSVLSSLTKIMLVFAMFCAAFVSSFYILSNRKHGFESITSSIISILIMTLGEVSYADFQESIELQHDGDLLIVIFVILMPIALMNLMIGVAVGDIDKIQRNAYLKRIGLQVDLMYSIENNMPRFLQKKLHQSRTTIKPNEEPNVKSHRFRFFGTHRKVQFIAQDQKDRLTSKLEILVDKSKTQQRQIKSIMMCLQHQNILIQDIAKKLNIHSTLPQMSTLNPIEARTHNFGRNHGRLSNNMSNNSDVLPTPKNLSVYSNVNIEEGNRWRKKSIRPTKHITFA